MCGKKVAAITMCGEKNNGYCSPDETWNLRGDPVIPGEGADDTIRVVGTQVFFSPTGSSDNGERWMLKLLSDVVQTGHVQRTEEADGSGLKLLHQWFGVMWQMRSVLFIGGEIPKQEARKVRFCVLVFCC